MIYLDNSATTFPKPPSVRQALLRAFSDLGANPGRGGYPMAMRTAQAVYDCRARAAAFFGARGPECVCFTGGCTQSLNTVLQGELRPGDHAVVSDLEHNAVMRPLTALGKKGVSYSVAAVVPGDGDATLENFRRAMRPETKLAVCTQASNVFGLRAPVERIAALCHQYGAKLCVDAAQSAGLAPISMEHDGIDYLCCAGHKGLYGVMGLGLLILRDPADDLPPLTQGGTGSRSRELSQPEELPDRLESGTLNVPGILALKAGLDFVAARGPESLWREEMGKTALLYDKLSRLSHVRLYTPPPRFPESFPVLSFTVEGLPSEGVGAFLGARGIAVRCGLHCAPTAHEKLGTLPEGTVRVSPGAFTREADVLALARAVALLGEKGQRARILRGG